MSTERHLFITISVENLVAEEALRLVILSFSIDSQCKKATPEFFEGAPRGEGGRNGLRKVITENLQYFLNSAYIQGISSITQAGYSMQISEMNFEWSVI